MESPGARTAESAILSPVDNHLRTMTRATLGRSEARSGDPGSSGWALAAALAALLVCLLTLVAAGESEWPIFVLGIGGLIAGRVIGIPDRRLVAIAVALILLAWPTAMFTSPAPRATSTFSHLVIAGLLAWFLAAPIRARRPSAVARPWSRGWFAIPAFVLAIGVVWELGEWLADAVVSSDLALSPLDTLADLAADFVGASVGLAFHDRAASRIGSPDADSGAIPSASADAENPGPPRAAPRKNR